MSCVSGRDGVIKLKNGAGADEALAQIKSWSISEVAETTECSFMGQTGNYRQYKTNMKNWSGSAEVVYDKHDYDSQTWDHDDDSVTTAVDAAMVVVGDTYGITVYPEGTGNNMNGDVIVTSMDINASAEDTISCTISFQGTGALSRD